MTRFDPEFFKKTVFSKVQITGYLEKAYRDLEIAGRDSFTEVRFSYGYQALIKGCIALIAKSGSVKVRALPGHHIRLLEKTGEILADSDIFTTGNAMRMKRNDDLYGDAGIVTDTEADEYLKFVRMVLSRIREKVHQEK